MAKPFYFILILLLGCSKHPSVPDNVLPAAEMAKILTQVHINQTLVTRMNFVKADSSQMAYSELERRTFLKLKVDTAKYRRSYRFYAEHPFFMKEIYGLVEKEVLGLKRIDSLAKVKRIRLDSLAKAKGLKTDSLTKIKGPGKPNR